MELRDEFKRWDKKIIGKQWLGKYKQLTIKRDDSVVSVHAYYEHYYKIYVNQIEKKEIYYYNGIYNILNIF